MPKRSKVTRNDALYSDLLLYCRAKGVETPLGGEEELKFAADFGRDFRFDAAWPVKRFAIEFQGGGDSGRHARFYGYANDAIKLAYAQMLGWRLYYVTTHQASFGMHLAIADCELGLKSLAESAEALKELSERYKPPRRKKSEARPSSRVVLPDLRVRKRVGRRKKGK